MLKILVENLGYRTSNSCSLRSKRSTAHDLADLCLTVWPGPTRWSVKAVIDRVDVSGENPAIDLQQAGYLSYHVHSSFFKTQNNCVSQDHAG